MGAPLCRLHGCAKDNPVLMDPERRDPLKSVIQPGWARDPHPQTITDRREAADTSAWPPFHSIRSEDRWNVKSGRCCRPICPGKPEMRGVIRVGPSVSPGIGQVWQGRAG